MTSAGGEERHGAASGRGGSGPAGEEPILAVRDLRVSMPGAQGETCVVEGVSLELRRGEALALVGESGSGKSMTAMALMGLTRAAGARVEGSVLLDGVDLSLASEADLRQVRGRRIGMVFQDPATALDPVQRIGRQIAEQIEVHGAAPPGGIEPRVLELLERVRLPRAADTARRYPFELSGGMRQRATIAMAISCDPQVLVADEPTAALDAVVQAEVLGLLDELRRERGMAVLLATHDLRAVARIADRVAVMRAGRILEAGPAQQVLARPRHDHTRRLVRRTEGERPEATSPDAADPLLAVDGLHVEFSRRGPWRLGKRGREGLRAVDGVSLHVSASETLALVGGSGSGKTTLARAVLCLVEPSEGSVAFRGRELTGLGARALRPLRPELQGVFQDPAASLNPRRRVRSIVAAPLRRHGRARAEAEARAAELLERVELSTDHLDRFPHQLSGGQRQRVGIARALALEPRLVVLDEPVSALDAPVRGQVMELLQRLQRELGLAYLLISHDLDLVSGVAHRVAVMDEGRLVETGAPEDLMERPEHPATRALVAAAHG